MSVRGNRGRKKKMKLAEKIGYCWDDNLSCYIKTYIGNLQKWMQFKKYKRQDKVYNLTACKLNTILHCQKKNT